jgi:hypothetical protein
MSSQALHPSVQRDRSLQRLSDLTYAIAAGAAGLLGLFSIVAAATVPGQSDGSPTASTATTATDPNQPGFTQPAGGVTITGGGEFQRPSQGSVSQVGNTAPHVVSGGSR